MITRMVIENFKSFKRADLKLGRLNVFIGANASGKSNFFDAMRLLQGIGYGFTVHEILDGKPKSATSETWEKIRGGSEKALFMNGTGPNQERLIRFEIGLTSGSEQSQTQEYSIALSPELGAVRTEKFKNAGKDLYDTNPEGARAITNLPDAPVLTARYYHGKQRGSPPQLDFEKTRPVLRQLARRRDCVEKHEKLLHSVAQQFSNLQRIDPRPTLLREYSQAREIRRMGESGENFAALIKTILADPKTKTAYESWLKELRPREVDEVGTLAGALGEPLFMIKEGGKEFPAQVLSDGTLRFAAVAAALFQPDLPGLMAIEEIENGVHASRLRLMVELLRNRTANGNTQVMVTTHSPIVLAWLKPEEYATTFFCKRDDESGESIIKPLTEIPHFNDVVKKQPIGDLFAEGWLEAAL